MADYIYLLENRLSSAQQRALSTIRNLVRSHELTLFLTGGAVRDLTGGGSVRDLDVTVQGDVSPLRKELEDAGAVFLGENAPAKALYFRFPGGVRVEISTAMSVSFPKPGQPQYEPASIAEDLRRRDFTANAMALSLNEGSFGLLMDPLNGVADIENRELRLVSNYGFLEDPSRMIRAARISSRLGWQMEEKTAQRYSNAKAEDLSSSISKFSLGYELEEIFHEEDPLRIMRALDGEGWLKVLAPEMILGKANETALADLREKQGQLQTQGILSDGAALAFPLIVAKLAPPEVTSLKARFARPGFVNEIETVEERTRELQTPFGGKDAGTPSAAWRMLHAAEPNLVLSLFYSSKSGSIQSRIKTFLNDSPGARQRLPYAVLLEMRITPDLPGYHDLLDKLFFELMDGKLGTTEELKAYLEPYSPPAPPPPINLRRARVKKEPRASRAKGKKAVTVAEQEEAIGVQEGLMEPGTLTGKDHGTEPEIEEPLEGKVAPLARGEAEPKLPKAKRPVKEAFEATAEEQAELGSSAAKSLTAKASPMVEEQALRPHPIATKDIAERASASTPEEQQAAGKPKKQALKSEKTQVSVVAPVGKAAKEKGIKANPSSSAADSGPAKSGPPQKAGVSGKISASKTGAVPSTKSAPPTKGKVIVVTPPSKSPAVKGNAKPAAAPVKATVKTVSRPGKAAAPSNAAKAKGAPVKAAAKSSKPATKAAKTSKR